VTESPEAEEACREALAVEPENSAIQAMQAYNRGLSGKPVEA